MKTEDIAAQEEIGSNAAMDTPLTEEQARSSILRAESSIASWARKNGFSVELTRMVLAGKRKCLRGQSLQIAVALRLKVLAE